MVVLTAFYEDVYVKFALLSENLTSYRALGG